jgi:predicted ribosome quality control (RQC) complex YloA/Tae2 family protein
MLHFYTGSRTIGSWPLFKLKSQYIKIQHMGAIAVDEVSCKRFKRVLGELMKRNRIKGEIEQYKERIGELESQLISSDEQIADLQRLVNTYKHEQQLLQGKLDRTLAQYHRVQVEQVRMRADIEFLKCSKKESAPTNWDSVAMIVTSVCSVASLFWSNYR